VKKILKMGGSSLLQRSPIKGAAALTH